MNDPPCPPERRETGFSRRDRVREIGPVHREPAPRMGARPNTESFKDMGKREVDSVLILDIDRVFSAHDLGSGRLRGTKAART
jgi:purine-binding chemotaxis protein CheW